MTCIDERAETRCAKKRVMLSRKYRPPLTSRDGTHVEDGMRMLCENSLEAREICQRERGKFIDGLSYPPRSSVCISKVQERLLGVSWGIIGRNKQQDKGLWDREDGEEQQGGAWQVGH